MNNEDVDNKLNEIFSRLNEELVDSVERKYFGETRDFRSLIEVVALIGQKVEQTKTVNEH